MARRLRISAIVLLFLGVAGGVVGYRTGVPPLDPSYDVSTAGTSKNVQRDIEVNVGKMGVLMSELLEDWQDPATRAATVIVSATVVAGICFFFARLLDLDEEDSPDKTDLSRG